METAWINYDLDVFTVEIPFTSPLGPVFGNAFFQELDGNASATNVRGMDYYMDGVFIESFNSSADKPYEVYATADIQGLLYNITIVRSRWSNLVPMLNALEMYSKLSFNSSTTSEDDRESSMLSKTCSVILVSFMKAFRFQCSLSGVRLDVSMTILGLHEDD